MHFWNHTFSLPPWEHPSNVAPIAIYSNKLLAEVAGHVYLHHWYRMLRKKDFAALLVRKERLLTCPAFYEPQLEGLLGYWKIGTKSLLYEGRGHAGPYHSELEM
jgi:hypothetical protein